MSKFKRKEVSEFSLEGRFLDFVFEGDKCKYLRMATSEGECWIKLGKQLRVNFELRLIPGDWLQVVGEKKLDLQTGKLKLKAERVIPAADIHTETALLVKATAPKCKTNILMCQKSDCMKRGGKAVCQAIDAALSAHGLEHEVAIVGTGCMKNCKAGPNLVMPDKTRYSRIQAAQIPALMNKHVVRSSMDERKANERGTIAIVG